MTSSPPTAKRERVAIVLALLAAAVLRFQALDLMEFKGDEAAACLMAEGVAEGKWLPQSGLGSGVGVRNLPAFVYVMAAPSLLTLDPIWLAAFIGLLNVAAVAVCWRIGRDFFSRSTGIVAAWLFAVAPWAVLYSRKIWAQSTLPLVSAALLYALLQVLVRGNRRYTFLVVFLALLAPQLHFAGGCATLMALLLLVLFRPKLSGRGAACGVLAAAIVAAPYLWLQVRTGFEDVRGATRVASGGSAQRNRTARTAAAGKLLLDISGMGDLRYVLGDSAAAFEAETRVPLDAHWLWLALLVGGLVEGVACAARRHRAAAIVLAWFAAPMVVYGLAGLRTWPHYLVVAFPAPFLIMAWSLRGPRWWRRAALSGACVAMLAGVAFNAGLLSFVEEHGGTQGDYGVAYCHKRAAAQYLMQRTSLKRLYASHDTRGKTAVRAEYRRLLTLYDAPPSSRSPGPLVRAVIVEPGRDPLDAGELRMLEGKTRRDFGPVRVYTWSK